MSKNKVKICFFSPASYPFFVPQSNILHGGAEFQMYLWADELANVSPFNIYFFIGKYGKIQECTNLRFVETDTLKNKESLFVKLCKAVKLFYKLIIIAPDVLITTNANAFVGIFAIYTRLFNKKLIYRTSHIIDINTVYIKNNGISGIIYKYGLMNAEKVIVQNKEDKFELKKNHNLDSIVIKNSFKIKHYHITEKQILLWVARFQKWKNPYLFLDLAKQIPSENFVMICPYNPSDHKKWEILKSEAEKIPNLKFIEKIAFSKIQSYFNKAKIFVNTSDFEGFPNTFLQAAQGKTPIVSLNVNPDNFLNEYNCGIFCKNDFNLLIRETKKLLQEPAEQILKGENAYRYLKENHDINKIGKQLEEIIYDLIGKNIF